MRTLPAAVVAYQRTQEFTEETLPDGLRRAHTTKPGTWARIHVCAGKLRYRVLAEDEEEFVLEPGRDGVVQPEVPHCVEPMGAVRFFVEFLREPV